MSDAVIQSGGSPSGRICYGELIAHCRGYIYIYLFLNVSSCITFPGSAVKVQRNVAQAALELSSPRLSTQPSQGGELRQDLDMASACAKRRTNLDN